MQSRSVSRRARGRPLPERAELTCRGASPRRTDPRVVRRRAHLGAVESDSPIRPRRGCDLPPSRLQQRTPRPLDPAVGADGDQGPREPARVTPPKANATPWRSLIFCAMKQAPPLHSVRNPSASTSPSSRGLRVGRLHRLGEAPLQIAHEVPGERDDGCVWQNLLLGPESAARWGSAGEAEDVLNVGPVSIGRWSGRRRPRQVSVAPSWRGAGTEPSSCRSRWCPGTRRRPIVLRPRTVSDPRGCRGARCRARSRSARCSRGTTRGAAARGLRFERVGRETWPSARGRGRPGAARRAPRGTGARWGGGATASLALGGRDPREARRLELPPRAR